MATKMEDLKHGVMVSVITGFGRRRRIPRNGILVPYGDPDALKEVLIQQAEAARKAVGMQITEREPVA